MNYLESMRVVLNIGGIYGIPSDDEERPMEGVGEKPRPRGRRNMRPRGERAQQQSQYIPKGGVPTDSFQNRVGT